MPEGLGFIVHTYSVHERSFPKGMRIVTQVPLPSLLSMVMLPPQRLSGRTPAHWSGSYPQSAPAQAAALC